MIAAALVLALAGALPGGGQYIVHPDPQAATVAIDLWYRVPAAGYSNASPGIARVAIAAVAASAPAKGTSLAALVKRDGGDLTINVYPDIAMIGASVPAWQASAVLRAMTGAFFAPDITQDAYKTAVRDSAIASAQQQYSAEQTLQNALFSRLFSAGPAHVAPLPGSPAEVTKISAADVRAFAARAFRQQNAVISVAGNVDDKLLADARTGVNAQSVSQDGPYDSTPVSSANPPDAVINGPVSGLGVAFAGPPIADEKGATAMDFLADYLFDPDYGVVSEAYASRDDVFVSGQFITLHDPGVLIGTIAGSGSDAVRAHVLAALDALKTPMSQTAFEAARNAFVYHILAQSQTPAGRADNAGWYAVEGNPGYAPGDPSGRYLQIAQSLDPAYVASVAAKYLAHPAIVQLIATPKAGSST